MRDLPAEGLQITEALQVAKAMPDPIERFHALDVVHDQVVALAAAIRIEQGAALGELRRLGTPWAELADRAGITSWQYAQKLVNAARAARSEE